MKKLTIRDYVARKEGIDPDKVGPRAAMRALNYQSYAFVMAHMDNPDFLVWDEKGEIRFESKLSLMKARR